MVTRWEDLEEWERLAAKLADAGPTDDDARAWVQEVMDAARADEREKIKAEYAPVLMEHLRILAALRARLEALPPTVRRTEVLAAFDGIVQ